MLFVAFGLRRGGFERTPGVEAAREAVRLVALPHQAQLPRMFGFFRAHVLDVNLKKSSGEGHHVGNTQGTTMSTYMKVTTHLAGFETEFDLHLAGLRADPHVHLGGMREGLQSSLLIDVLSRRLESFISQHQYTHDVCAERVGERRLFTL